MHHREWATVFSFAFTRCIIFTQNVSNEKNSTRVGISTFGA